MPKWLLKSIEINGGFLPGFLLELPPGLTCIIGPRGSGKTTLAEMLRYGIGGTSATSNLPLLQATMSSSSITLVSAPLKGEPAYTIRRAFKQPATLVASDGRAIQSIDLDRGTFLPLDAYNSGEIEAIADETLGQKRRGLLDELCAEELQRVSLSIGEARRALEANADAIAALRRTIRDLAEQTEEMGDPRAKLAALPPAAGGDSQPLMRVTQQQQAAEADLRALDEAAVALEEFEKRMHGAAARQRERLPEIVNEDSPHAPQMRAAQTVIEDALGFAEERFGEMIGKLEQTRARLLELRGEIEQAIAARSTELSRLQDKNKAAGEAVRARSEAEQAVARLAAFERRRAEEQGKLAKLLEERQQLKGAWLLERENVSTLRHQVAEQLQKSVGACVRVRVLQNADNLAYQQKLLDSLKGARVRNHDEILVALMRLRPEQLAQIVQENDLAEFEALVRLGSERSAKVLEAFRSNLNPLDVEVVEIDDRVCIELNVAGGAEPHFKDAAELSKGQKCTALLPLLLSRRDNPLVIDQPEDNLDNHFIYETVVEAVRRLKTQRQMIFITHNANIPVLGGADHVVVMNSDGRRGYVENAGTLDACRDEIIDLLEGGRKAFEERRRRYGAS